MSTFDIYCRISQEGDRSKAEVAEQLDLYEGECRAWAEKQRIDVSVVIRESNVSGTTAIEERGLGELIERVESGESAGILTPYLDRFGRDMIAGALAYRRIKLAGGRLVCVSDGTDSDREGDELVFNLRMAIAQDYLNRVRANFLARNQKAARDGAYLACLPPTGYDRGENGRLSMSARCKKLIREAYQRRAEGQTFAGIAAWLRGAGVGIETRDERKPEGKQTLRPFDVLTENGARHILSNRAYLGEQTVQSGRKGDPDVLTGGPWAVITSELYERAQAAGGKGSAARVTPR